MKSTKIIIITLAVALLLLALSPVAKSQILDTTHVIRIELPQSNEQFPAWSKDGTRLVFQSTIKGHSEIFLYDFTNDSLIQVAGGKANMSHPVFIPGSNDIAYDKMEQDGSHLYKINLNSGNRELLFKRDILCKASSFSPSGRLVAFIGWDKKSDTWQIFSYDFVYDNLNRLTNLKDKELYRPLFSPDGKTILFGSRNKTNPFDFELHQINWYGENLQKPDSIASTSYCWSTNGYRIVCAETNHGKEFRLITIRKDGTVPMCLSADTVQRITPAYSPGGRKIAVAENRGNNFDIVIYNVANE